MNKHLMTWILFSLMVLSLVSGCATATTTPGISPTPTSAPIDAPSVSPTLTPQSKPEDASIDAITIRNVSVANRQILVRGTTTLPDDACITTELWNDAVRIPWWPTETCAVVRNGAWKLQIDRSEGDMLESGYRHFMRAYAPGSTDPASIFPFDVAAPLAPIPTGEITIQGVNVTADQMTIQGTSSLSDGTCLNTELWADGAPLPWWPTDACATVEAGAWELQVPLSEGQTLQSGVQYMVRAYLPGGPDIVGTFPFDLDGPPSP